MTFEIYYGHILILESNQEIYILNALHFNGSEISYMDLILAMLYDSLIQSKSRIFLLHEGMHISYNWNHYVHINLLHVNK